MKKFLTVLLALSVVFTYTVGSAFATDDKAAERAALNDAKAIAEKVITDNYDAAMKTIVALNLDYLHADDVEIAAAWAKIDVKGQLTTYINEQYVAEADTNFGKHNADPAIYAYKVFGISTKDDTTYVDPTEGLRNKILELMAGEAVLNMYNEDYKEAISPLSNIDWSLYSEKMNEESGKTYLEEAKDKIAEIEELVKTYTYTLEDKKPGAYLESAIQTVEYHVSRYVTSIKIGDSDIDSGLYSVNGVKTIKDLEDGDRNEAAEIAATKALIQTKYASYLKEAKADKELADAYVEVFNYLAEHGVVDRHSEKFYYPIGNYAWAKTRMLTAISNIEDLVAFGEKYKAEKDATGAYVRDAEAVDEEVEKAHIGVYAAAVAATVPATIETQSIANAEENIIALSVKTDAAELAFAKEVAKKTLENAKAEIIDDYYALEAAKVEANYAKVLEKIEAAKKVTDAENAVKNLDLGANIDTKEQVNTNILEPKYTAAGPAKDAFNRVVAYRDYANHGKTVLDADFIIEDAQNIKDALNKIYGEAGARTNTEIKAVTVDAEAVAKSLPTVGALDAAKKAAEDAIKALPAKVTEADKDAVIAAWEAAVAYEELGGTLAADVDAKLTKAIGALKADMNKNFAIAVAKVDKTDKAALRELQAQFDAADELFGEDELFGAVAEFDDSKVVDALEKVRAAELAAVKKLINALPVHVTLGDKAQIEAARKAYDTFVEEWTDYSIVNKDGTIGYDAAAQFKTVYRELALAEAELSILEKDAAVKATESLKISVSTKLYTKSNKIRVNWKVKDGDASYITGYQVYKSTKAHSNYKFMGKTTKNYMDNKKSLKKGQRYYYKVRAYVDVDGERYYSDWSNKGNRIYK